MNIIEYDYELGQQIETWSGWSKVASYDSALLGLK